MGRKRNPYIQLFTRDILSSPRCRALSEQAAGVYFFLLCRLNEPPMPGAYRLRDWDPHPTWKRSKTQQCLATPDKYERLPYFASMLAKNDLPWKQGGILAGLQELYRYGIIVVEGDMLVQPRMLKDNRIALPDIDADGDPVNTILDEPASGSMIPLNDDEIFEVQNRYKKSTKKVQKKVQVSHAPATRALSVENMSNNKKNSISKGGAGGKESKQKIAADGVKNSKTDKCTSKDKKTQETPSKRKIEGAERQGANTPIRNKIPPTIEDVQAYITEQAEKGKPFQYITAEGFYDACAQSGWTLKNGKPIKDWQARLRTFEIYRKEHGDAPVNQRKASAPPGKGQAVPTQDNKEYEEW